MKSKYLNDDRTFCANRRCSNTKCDINPIHRINKGLSYYSVAAYENSKFCPKNPKHKEWKERKNGKRTDN